MGMQAMQKAYKKMVVVDSDKPNGMKRLLIAALFLTACEAAPQAYSVYPTPDTAQAAAVLVAATTTEDAARIERTQMAWAPTATAASLANDSAALALTPTAAYVTLQMTADARSATLAAHATDDAETLREAQFQAAIDALTPTATPWPTPAPTVDAYAAQRERDTGDWLAMVVRLAPVAIILVALACLIILAGAAANRVEGETQARKIEAQGKADAERTRAEGDAYARRMEARAGYERSHMSVVQPGAQVVINSPSGTVQVLSVGGAPQGQTDCDISPLAPIARMAGGRTIEPLDRLNSLERQAVDYLAHSAGLVGWDNALLPTASQTNNSTLRQESIKALRAAGLVDGAEGKGGRLHVVGYDNIRGLHSALSQAQVHLTAA